DEFKEQDINIVLICDGTANTFSQFLTHWKNAKYKNIAFLYDFNRSIPKYEIEGYPTELLTDGKLIIKKEKGF
ncbi:MAG TPA: hypothetical protein PLS00_14860, partial [Niabella sp.]|nr:hypothetical protein [Niabella sp.]